MVPATGEVQDTEQELVPATGEVQDTPSVCNYVLFSLTALRKDIQSSNSVVMSMLTIFMI